MLRKKVELNLLRYFQCIFVLILSFRRKQKNTTSLMWIVRCLLLYIIIDSFLMIITYYTAMKTNYISVK